MIWSWNIWQQEQKIKASIFLIALFNYLNYCTQLTQWCNDATYQSYRILLKLKLNTSDRAYVKVLSQVHIHYDLHVVHWWSRRKQECCDLQKLTRQVVRAVTKLTQINLSYRGLHSDVPPVCCEVSRALTRRGLATLARLRTEARPDLTVIWPFVIPSARVEFAQNRHFCNQKTNDVEHRWTVRLTNSLNWARTQSDLEYTFCLRRSRIIPFCVSYEVGSLSISMCTIDFKLRYCFLETLRLAFD